MKENAKENIKEKSKFLRKAMARKSVIIIINSVLWILTAVSLIVSDLWIYARGRALKAVNPMADIYSMEVISQAAVYVLLFFAAAAALTIFCMVSKISDHNADRPVLEGRVIAREEENRSEQKKRNRLRLAVFMVAIVFILAGIMNGSMNDVFVKASKICTECIGLG